ncbi:molecular chaperone DnaJ [Candidatus Woesearchaeota archaeon]|nr:molecular chaperone DnaJ [Candidatus Woesearchaeota archaeon]
MAKDYYETLGVSKKATREEIKSAYKKLAKKYHPDVSKEPDAAEKFKEINEAAAVLGDDQKRQQYDQFGTADTSGFDFSGFESAFRGFGGFDFDSIFDSFFGGGFGRRERGPRRGSDLLYTMEISLEDAFNGTEKTIIIPKTETCTKCNGSGAESDADIETCNTCNGTGMVRRTRRTPFGIFSTSSACDRCRGEGRTIKRYCPVCDGNGIVNKTKKINVKIPQGIDSGNRLRVAGEGEAGEKGGPPGHLYVEVHVKEHKLFERKDDDLYTEIPISFVTAALGGETHVDSFTGKVTMKIPAGTQSHTLFKVKDKGMPRLQRGGHGNLLVRTMIQTPTKLTVKQKELLKKYAEAGGDKVQEKKFFDKLKDAFS